MSVMEFIAIIVASLFVSFSTFQVILALGYPFGKFAMGGYYTVLPTKLRIASAFNALLLLLMALIFLQHTNVLDVLSIPFTNRWVWFITAFLGINTLANLFSRSPKERLVMTPLSGITFLLCLWISLS